MTLLLELLSSLLWVLQFYAPITVGEPFPLSLDLQFLSLKTVGATFLNVVVPTVLIPKDCLGDISPFVGPTISGSQLKTVGATFLSFVVPTVLGPQDCLGNFSPFVGPTISDTQLKTVGATFLSLPPTPTVFIC